MCFNITVLKSRSATAEYVLPSSVSRLRDLQFVPLIFFFEQRKRRAQRPAFSFFTLSTLLRDCSCQGFCLGCDNCSYPTVGSPDCQSLPFWLECSYPTFCLSCDLLSYPTVGSPDCQSLPFWLACSYPMFCLGCALCSILRFFSLYPVT